MRRMPRAKMAVVHSLVRDCGFVGIVGAHGSDSETLQLELSGVEVFGSSCGSAAAGGVVAIVLRLALLGSASLRLWRSARRRDAWRRRRWSSHRSWLLNESLLVM